LTSARPYKKAWLAEEAVKLIRENRKTHFDPELVNLFLADVASFVKIKDAYQDAPEHSHQ
jgi:putative two-component system response regulator